MAKPFVKWAGGKGKLLMTLVKNLPIDFTQREHVTYVEPFVGGGAMLFHMLETFPNIDRAIINDINPELILCYRMIKEEPEMLISQLKGLEDEFYAQMSNEERKLHYYTIRRAYNQAHLNHPEGDLFAEVERAAWFIYLNRTCFNGLYRENGHGIFNVPVGKSHNPQICNDKLLMDLHQVLSKVEILNGDYHAVLDCIEEAEYAFFYFDPPYRPLEGSKNFNDYSMSPFNDQQQIELKEFCDLVFDHGHELMLSNSCCETFFTELYQGYNLQKVSAPRFINADGKQRKAVDELLIRKYKDERYA